LIPAKGSDDNCDGGAESKAGGGWYLALLSFLGDSRWTVRVAKDEAASTPQYEEREQREADLAPDAAEVEQGRGCEGNSRSKLPRMSQPLLPTVAWQELWQGGLGMEFWRDLPDVDASAYQVV